MYFDRRNVMYIIAKAYNRGSNLGEMKLLTWPDVNWLEENGLDESRSTKPISYNINHGVWGIINV